MTRLNLVLLLAVMASAMYLVRTQYESRNLTVQLDRETRLARRLDVEFDRLQVERRAQATPLRVEKLAKEQLHMRTTTPAITQYVSAASGTLIPMPSAPPASAPARPGARP
ncbi:MAG TPA: cell division protein FtsL [Pseudorhodoferax sp.]|jgi:cell division protein FtsL|nr:cell division protein FtsL [Pseudorhodoferax sp.]